MGISSQQYILVHIAPELAGFFLQQDAQIAGKLAPRPGLRRFSSHDYGGLVSAVSVTQAAQRVYQGSLAATVLAEYGPAFAWIDGQVQVVAQNLAGILQG